MVTVITAQVPIASLPVHSSGFAKYKDRFFIHGGVTTGGNANADNISGQFFYLDLSKRWTSVSPAWNKLPEGPKNVSEIALSLDGKILVAFIGNPIQAIHGFSFESRTWSISKVSFQNSTKGIFPVTLGQDGTVLIAGGSSLDNVYHIYSFDVDSLVTHSLPPSPFPGKKFLPGREFYQAVWSEPFKSAFFFGGSIYGVFAGNASTANILSVYNAETKAWTERLRAVK
ncbi:hypothetical protein BGW42_007296 [Actinomortierella wolfii]|nr:hypothetical protein BGW42_007296 [Actinomortierella wolfii]